MFMHIAMGSAWGAPIRRGRPRNFPVSPSLCCFSHLFSATNNTTENFKRVYSAEEQEDARYFLASDGMLQAAYFTSALQRFRRESPDSELNDLAVAALISSQ